VVRCNTKILSNLTALPDPLSEFSGERLQRKELGRGGREEEGREGRKK